MNQRALICILTAALLLWAGMCAAANDRPLVFGMNPTPMSWWEKDPEVWDPLLYDKMAQAGCASARIGVNWDAIEPVEGVRDWSEIDRLVSLCLDHNIEPLILINSTPEWALPDYVDPAVSFPTARYPPAEEYAETFKEWCHDLVRRYRGRARYYEFWNEANGYGWYTALLPSPSYGRADLYTPWMIRAYQGVKLGDPTSLMSTTGIDDGGDGHAPGFLEGIYNYGGKGYFDVVCDHPYPGGGYFQCWKLDNIRTTLDAHGDTDVDIWISEFGYNWSDFTDELVYYFDILTQSQYDYVRIATWHTANEFPWEAGFGLLDPDLNPKPEYYSFQNYPKPSRPVISSIVVTNLTPSSALVTYDTDVPAASLVMYGPDTNYGWVTDREDAASTTHQALLVGLEPNSEHHCRVRAGAVEDGDSFSGDITFTTMAGPVVQVTSGPDASNISKDGATVTWTTDAASSSTVEYSTDFGFDSSTTTPGLTTNHSVTLTGLDSATDYQYRVVSSADGYADAVREGRAFTTEPGFGTLVNGGFEDASTGWTYWEVHPWGAGAPDYPGHISIYSNAGAYPPSPASMEGSYRITCDVGWASAVGGLYQTITTPNGFYEVSGWVAAGCDGGGELIELIAIDGEYEGGIPDGARIASLSDSSGWNYHTGIVNVTTNQLTIALRVSQYAAVTAVAGHFDGISVQPIEIQPETIGAVKYGFEDDAVATDGGKAVTALVDLNTFYIQEDDRSSGIKVITSGESGVGMEERVSVAGKLRVIDGEAVIDAATVTSKSSAQEPEPLCMTPRWLGGNALGLQPAVEPSGHGTNNVGLLVRTFGQVTSVATDSFAISDGSGIDLKCSIAAADTLVSTGDFVGVTGVSSCEITGDQNNRLLILRTPLDIVEFAEL